ncbi:MAG: hypothetical protein KC414_14650, partial [Romboutsia sp.]|nr:hypothetical protein [Romboutsia sp.]
LDQNLYKLNICSDIFESSIKGNEENRCFEVTAKPKTPINLEFNPYNNLMDNTYYTLLSIKQKLDKIGRIPAISEDSLKGIEIFNELEEIKRKFENCCNCVRRVEYQRPECALIYKYSMYVVTTLKTMVLFDKSKIANALLSLEGSRCSDCFNACNVVMMCFNNKCKEQKDNCIIEIENLFEVNACECIEEEDILDVFCGNEQDRREVCGLIEAYISNKEEIEESSSSSTLEEEKVSKKVEIRKKKMSRNTKIAIFGGACVIIIAVVAYFTIL